MVIYYDELSNLFREVSNAYVEDAKVYIVRKINNKIYCECNDSTFYGIPCRHELALCITALKDPNILHFEKRWEIKYFKFEEIDFKEERNDSEVNILLLT